MPRTRKLEPRLHMHLKIDPDVRARLDKFIKATGWKGKRGGIAAAVNALLSYALEEEGYP